MAWLRNQGTDLYRALPEGGEFTHSVTYVWGLSTGVQSRFSRVDLHHRIDGEFVLDVYTTAEQTPVLNEKILIPGTVERLFDNQVRIRVEGFINTYLKAMAELDPTFKSVSDELSAGILGLTGRPGISRAYPPAIQRGFKRSSRAADLAAGLVARAFFATPGVPRTVAEVEAARVQLRARRQARFEQFASAPTALLSTRLAVGTPAAAYAASATQPTTVQQDNFSLAFDGLFTQTESNNNNQAPVAAPQPGPMTLLMPLSAGAPVAEGGTARTTLWLRRENFRRQVAGDDISQHTANPGLRTSPNGSDDSIAGSIPVQQDVESLSQASTGSAPGDSTSPSDDGQILSPLTKRPRPGTPRPGSHS